MTQSDLPVVTLAVEPATPEAVRPFGRLVGTDAGLPVFASWADTKVFGPVGLEVQRQAELLLVQTSATSFPHQVGLIERHPLHTQTYLPVNAKPFIMVLGSETHEDKPDAKSLRAFMFAPGTGIVLDKGVWHDFPYALEIDTQFIVILSAIAHVDTLEDKTYPLDAAGPDLERRSLRERAIVWVKR